MSPSVATRTDQSNPPSRPKPKPNPRHKHIATAKASEEERAAFWAILKNSKLNARAIEICEAVRFLLEIMEDARERAHGMLLRDLVAAGFNPCANIGVLERIDETCAGFQWCLEQFQQAMINNCMPRSPADEDRIYGEDPNVTYATSDELLANVPDSPVRARRAATAGKRVPK